MAQLLAGRAAALDLVARPQPAELGERGQPLDQRLERRIAAAAGVGSLACVVVTP